MKIIYEGNKVYRLEQIQSNKLNLLFFNKDLHNRILLFIYLLFLSIFNIIDVAVTVAFAINK